MLALAGALCLVSSAASAQIGGPIGAPTGVPNGLPSGASGYSSNAGGGAPPPVNNWSAHGAGRSAFSGGRFNNNLNSRPWTENRNEQQEVPLPSAPQVQQNAPAAAGAARDPRQDDYLCLINKSEPTRRVVISCSGLCV